VRPDARRAFAALGRMPPLAGRRAIMVGMSDPDLTPAKRPGDKPEKTAKTRLAAATILGGVGAVFAFVNLEKVSVDWVVGSAQTPLIVVIVLSMLLGALIDRALVYRARRRKPGR
jgi:uncharacterized integral membrane protein